MGALRSPLRTLLPGVLLLASGCRETTLGCPDGRSLGADELCYLPDSGAADTGTDASDLVTLDTLDETAIDVPVAEQVTPDVGPTDLGSEVPCSQQLDPIDPAGTDTNCDGVDGVLGQIVFVSAASGNDSHGGTTPRDAV